MSEFGRNELEAVATAAERPKDDRFLANELVVGQQENIKSTEAQANADRKAAQNKAAVLRLEDEIDAIHAIIAEKKALEAQQQTIQKGGLSEAAAAVHAKLKATREGIIRTNMDFLKLSGDPSDLDENRLAALLVGKQTMMGELGAGKDELESKLPATGSI